MMDYKCPTLELAIAIKYLIFFTNQKSTLCVSCYRNKKIAGRNTFSSRIIVLVHLSIGCIYHSEQGGWWNKWQMYRDIVPWTIGSRGNPGPSDKLVFENVISDRQWDKSQSALL
jgi:hypothetical protein